jgi:hypothetical protein
MARRQHPRKQNLLSGTAFGLAIVLVVAGVVHLIKNEPSDLETGGVAGYAIRADADQAMAAVAPPPAPDIRSASAAVAARPAAVGRIFGEPLAPRDPDPASTDPAPLDSPTDSAGIQTAVQTIESAAGFEDAPTMPDGPEPLALAPAEAGSDLLAPAEFVAPAEDGSLDSLEPAAGPQPAARRMEVGEVLGLLRAQGFGSFSAVSQVADTFIFQARQGDRAVQVTVDAATGAVIGVQ